MTTHIVTRCDYGRTLEVVKPFRGRVWRFDVDESDLIRLQPPPAFCRDPRQDTEQVAFSMRPLMRHEIPQEILKWSFPSMHSQTDLRPAPWNP